MSSYTSPVRSRSSSSTGQKSPARTSVARKESVSNAEITMCRDQFAEAAGTKGEVDQKHFETLLFASPAAQRLALSERMVQDFLFTSEWSKPATSTPASPSKGSKPLMKWPSSKSKESRYNVTQFVRAHSDLAAKYQAAQENGVVIIGNGRSVLAHQAGPAIDRYKTVIRFNEYQLAGYEQHVGIKTSIWCLSDYTCIKLLNKYPDRTMPVLIAIPWYFMGKPYYEERRAQVYQDLTEEQRHRVTFISGDVASDIVTRYDFGDRWPSSGLIAIWHCLQTFPELMLHGFDFFKEIDGKIHYMEDSHKANHDSKQEERICHKLLQEGKVHFIA
mmetsp:Transcript_54346/g.90176  ORF Transcript_54346/g.90176 Transcript_54346/m.90176 type:complete len:331 (+) Transcript_54346:106-1098(+)